jgi:hypothetical protein
MGVEIMSKEKISLKSEDEINNVQQIAALGQSLAQEKLKNIQITSAMNSMGQELAKVKLDLIQKNV